MAPVGAVHVPAIALAAQMKQPPAVVESAENLPQIVHSRGRPPGTRPLRRTRATTLSSNASTRGDPGLGEVMTPGPTLSCGRADRPAPPPTGPTTSPARAAQISAVSGGCRHLPDDQIRARRHPHAMAQPSQRITSGKPPSTRPRRDAPTARAPISRAQDHRRANRLHSHSAKRVPTHLSAYPFCHDDLGAMRSCSTPRFRTRASKAAP